MEKEVVASIIAGSAGVAGATVGALFSWLLQRDTKARERDRKWIEKLEKEVRARIALEKAAVKWIAELKNIEGEGVGVKRELRNRQQQSGLRPKLSEGRLED
jgi:hypothetical protein